VIEPDEGGSVRVEAVTFEPLAVALREPFVIATGEMTATRAVWVRARVARPTGEAATGWGEAAALPPVTWEDQADLLALISAAAPELAGLALEPAAPERLRARLDALFPTSHVARAAVESAILDGWARLMGCPVAQWLGVVATRADAAPSAGAVLPATPATPRFVPPFVPAFVPPFVPPFVPATMVTDMTLPIASPGHMAKLAAGYREAGFVAFKVKVGRSWRADLRALRAVVAAVPDARFRLDANAGFTVGDATSLLHAALDAGMVLECFEQPCAREDWQGMARITGESPVPIVADESFRSEVDLERLLGMRAAHAVNLKLVKLGGPLAALALGRRARQHGLGLMAGAMVETRLGLVTMGHVVAALGGVEFVDLDTAFLLGAEPFSGGWSIDGPRLTLLGGPGLGLGLADPPGTQPTNAPPPTRTRPPTP
jgi:L-alanine-DL-glutamate epimerase-like enolase superfamily enzyme